MFMFGSSSKGSVNDFLSAIEQENARRSAEKASKHAAQATQNNADSTKPTTPQDYAEFWNNAFTGSLDYDRLNEMWQKAADYNTAAVREQREYQAQREDTAVLRYAEQLKQLGINPALAVGNAAGASGGTAASISAAAPLGSGQQGTQLLSLLVNTAAGLYESTLSTILKLIP